MVLKRQQKLRSGCQAHGYLGWLRHFETEKAAGSAFWGQAREPVHALENQDYVARREVFFLDCYAHPKKFNPEARS